MSCKLHIGIAPTVVIEYTTSNYYIINTTNRHDTILDFQCLWTFYIFILA